MKNKIKSRQELVEILNNKHEEKEIVFTNGCFDLLHVGHVRYLNKARQFGDFLVVGVNSDRSMKKLKGEKRPLVSQSDRAELIASLEAVDYVTIFSELTANAVVTLLKPDFYVKGGDYEIEELPEAEAVRDYGGQIKLVPEVKGPSTTEIISKIIDRYS